jgi:hypothetical protein
MADNEYAGSAMYLAWVYSGGTVTLQSDFRTFNWSPTLNFIDATAGADTYERLLPSYGVGGDITLNMLDQAGTIGVTMGSALARATQGTLVYGPAGTADNYIAYKIPAYSQGPQYNQPFDGVVEMNCNFRQYAVETRTNWSSGTVAP